MNASSGGDRRRDRPTVVRLLRETIVQLCRANAPFGGGRVEIDGIICITGSASGQELVVKVHEVLHDAVEAARPGGPPLSGLFDRERYGPAESTSVPDPAGGVDLKRRRLEVTSSSLADNLPMMSLAASALAPHHHSALYDYLSRFGLPSSPRITSDVDSRLAVKDLSLKSASAVRRRDSAAERSVVDGRVSPSRRPSSPAAEADRHLMGARQGRPALPLYVERWSPNQTIPAIPQCFVCGYRFHSAEALGEHNETVHSIFTCLCCFKTFTSRSNLERHSRLHTGHRPYACPVCGKTFSRKDHLSNHATKHAYKCGTCTRRCADQTALADHYRVEHPSIVLAAVCAYCNKGFSSVELYEEHVKVHPQFHVSAAGAEPSGDQLAPPPPPPPPRHQCQMCGFEAMDRVCLVQHQQLMHYAPMSLLHRDAFDNSPTTTSTMQRQSYRCVVCPYTTATVLALRQHEATHVYGTAAQPPFELSSRHLPRPTTSLQTDGQQVECHHCGHLFDSYTNLCQHLRDLSHQGDDTFYVSGQHRDKRKQKQPKPVMVAEADEDEEVNVVSPESADGKKSEEEHSTEQSDVDVKRSLNGSSLSSPGDDAPPEIRMEPIRSIMNRSSMPVVSKNCEGAATESSPSPPCVQQLCDEAISTAQQTPPPRLQTHDADDSSLSMVHNLSNNSGGSSIPYFALDRSPSMNSSPDDLSANNNNNNGDCKDGSGGVSVKSETQWMSSLSLAEQTRCIICCLECADFAEMESHCLSEHSRSPCTYCPKTFAQKANRDRHMCLHTGDRPYGCPECGERFARGDKLKMHRVRTHGVLYSLYGSRRDREAGTSSRNHSTSQSPMTLEGAEAASIAPIAAAVLNGASTGQDVADSAVTLADSDLRGSASVLSGGEWIDLRIGVCHESSKLQSALASIASAGQNIEHFPKREITEDEVASANGQYV